MPEWMKAIKDFVIYVGSDVDIELGEPVNRFNEALTVSLDLSSASSFAAYNPDLNAIVVRSVTMKDLGYFRVILKAQETKNDKVYTYLRQFYLIVAQSANGGK